MAASVIHKGQTGWWCKFAAQSLCLSVCPSVSALVAEHQDNISDKSDDEGQGLKSRSPGWEMSVLCMWMAKYETLAYSATSRHHVMSLGRKEYEVYTQKTLDPGFLFYLHQYTVVKIKNFPPQNRDRIVYS